MNVPNIYAGLEVEPFKVNMIEQIHLRGKVLSDTQFVFVAEYWEEQLKSYKRAKWTHDSYIYSGGVKVKCLHNYTLKQGIFLVFVEFKEPMRGGFYAAHLYSIVKELPDGPIYCTFTEEGLFMEAKLEGKVYQRVMLKPRPIQQNDTPYHVVLSY